MIRTVFGIIQEVWGAFYFDGLGERATRYREMKFFDILNCKETAIEVTWIILAADDNQTKFINLINKKNQRNQSKYQNKFLNNSKPKSQRKFYKPNCDQRRTDYKKLL